MLTLPTRLERDRINGSETTTGCQVKYSTMKQKIGSDGEIYIDYENSPLIHLLDVGNIEEYKISEHDLYLYHEIKFNDQSGWHTMITDHDGHMMGYRSEGQVMMNYDDQYIKIYSTTFGKQG